MQQSETNEEIKVGDIVEVINIDNHSFPVGGIAEIVGIDEEANDDDKYRLRLLNFTLCQWLSRKQFKKLPICKS